MRALSSKRAERSTAGVMLAIMLISLISIFAVMASRPPPAQAQLPGVSLPGVPGLPSPCDLLPDGTAEKVCKGIQDPVGTATGAVGIPGPSDLVGAAFDAVTRPFYEDFLLMEAEAVSYVLMEVYEFINSTTTVDLGSDWFKRVYGLIFGMAIFIALFGFFGRFASAAKDQNAAEMVRAGISLTTFLVMAPFIPVIVAGALLLFDGQMAPAWMAVGGDETNTVLKDLSKTLADGSSLTDGIVPILLNIVFLLLGVVGALIMWVLFFVREAAIPLVTAWNVVALGFWVSGRWSGDAYKRSCFVLLALLLFKLEAAIIFTFAIFIIGDAENGVENAFVGSVLLLLLPAFLIWLYSAVAKHQVNVDFNRRASAFAGFVGRFRK